MNRARPGTGVAVGAGATVGAGAGLGVAARVGVSAGARAGVADGGGLAAVGASVETGAGTAAGVASSATAWVWERPGVGAGGGIGLEAAAGVGLSGIALWGPLTGVETGVFVTAGIGTAFSAAGGSSVNATTGPPARSSNLTVVANRPRAPAVTLTLSQGKSSDVWVSSQS